MIIMIILLILCLPLILMLSLYTTTSAVSIVVDLPVSSIEVLVEDLVELDLDKGETLEVDYVIYPIEANNKNVNYIFSPIGSAKQAEFEVDGDTLIPTSAGQARVTVETVDGGHRDSFNVIVRSKKVDGITSTPQSSTLKVGESTKIDTVFSPEVVRNEGLSYRVKDGEGVVQVSPTGTVKAIGVGTAVIEVTSLDNPEAKSEFTVTVESSGIIDFANDTTYLTLLDNPGGTISTVMNPDAVIDSYAIELLDAEGNVMANGDDVTVTFNKTTGVISYEFHTNFVGRVEVKLTVTPEVGDAETKSCYIERISKFSVDWADYGTDGEFAVMSQSEKVTRIEIDLKPLGADVSYEIELNYQDKTDLDGELKSGVMTAINENQKYCLDGGYYSIQIESTSSGVYLVVTAERESDASAFGNHFTLTYITLYVKDNNDGSVKALDEISIVALPM